jgi:hypothetical protein
MAAYFIYSALESGKTASSGFFAFSAPMLIAAASASGPSRELKRGSLSGSLLQPSRSRKHDNRFALLDGQR